MLQVIRYFKFVKEQSGNVSLKAEFWLAIGFRAHE